MTTSRPGSSTPASPFVPDGEAPKPLNPSRRARQLLQLAHQAVYRLPATYPGFTADVLATSGAWTVRGAVDVHCPHGAVFRLDADDPGHDASGERPSADTITTVTTMILDLVSWQFPKRFDELDGRYEAGFRPDLDQPAKRAVQLLGESRRTIRWLDDDGVVATAYRQSGVAHHIEVVERHALEDGRWLPVRIGDTRRAEGAPDLHHRHTNEFLQVDGVHLPLRRVSTPVPSSADGADGATPAPPVEPATPVGRGPVTIELRDHRHHPKVPADR
jgi:hypothetical protein